MWSRKPYNLENITKILRNLKKIKVILCWCGIWVEYSERSIIG
jgi:hypothetical protein